MARIYNDRNDNPLANLAQSYLDERFRNRQQRLTGDELRFGQDIKAQDTYQKAKRDEYGNYQGLETDADLYGRDTEIARNKAPGFFERILQKAEPAKSGVSSLETGKPLDQEEPLDQMTRRITMENRAKAAELGLPSYNPNASRAAPAMPAKLLGPGKFEVDPSQVKPGDVLQKNTIQGDQDVTRYARPVEPIRGEGMAIAASPEKPEVKQSLSPSPMMLKDIRGMITSGTNKDADPLISAMSLPPSLRKELGLEGFKGDIPRSILSEMIKRRSGSNAGIDDVAAGLLTKVRQEGYDPGMALKDYSDITGKPASRDILNAFLRQAGQGEVTARQQKGFGQQDKRSVQGALSKARSEFNTESRESIKALAAATALKSLASDPNGQGFQRAMQFMASRASGSVGAQSDRDVESFSGVTGWSSQLQQIMSNIRGKGFTPENKENFIRLATAFGNAERAKLEAMREDQVISTMAEIQDYGIPEDRVRQSLNIDNQLAAAMKGYEVPPKQIGTVNPDPRNKSDKRMSNEQMLKLESVTAQTLRKIDSMNANPSEKRKMRQKVYDKYKEKSGGVEYLRKDGSAVP